MLLLLSCIQWRLKACMCQDGTNWWFHAQKDYPGPTIKEASTKYRYFVPKYHHCDVKGAEVHNTATTCPEMFWDCPVFLTHLSQPRDTRYSPGLSQVLVRENIHIPHYLVSQDTQHVLHVSSAVPSIGAGGQLLPPPTELELIRASLSEPHTSGTALRTCVRMFACLLACGHIP